MAFQASTCWGNPSSVKRALLIHGLTSASESFFRVAALLTAQGYYVVAPDLPCHGLSPSPPTSSVAAFAIALLPLVTPPQTPWTVIVGHSLGALVALQLLPNIESLPRLVLVDPPLEMSPSETRGVLEGTLADFSKPKSAAEFLESNPRWSQKDAVIKVYGEAACDRDGVAAIIRDNVPWSFTHLIPPASYPTEIIILGAHKDPAFTAGEATTLTKTRPDVVVSVIPNTSHSIHREDPEAVAKWILEGKLAG
ncbi:hypothetical protein P7C70_g2786, partial [Phenoliferia sp. Uapishka_3]